MDINSIIASLQLSHSSYGTVSPPVDWIQVDTNGIETSTFITDTNGFQGAIYKNKNTGQIIVAFCGSNGINDWLLSNLRTEVQKLPAQYTNALKLYNDAIKLYGAGNVTVTGQSLGGILAQLVCAKTDAIGYTYNTAGIQALLPLLGIDKNKIFSNITNFSLDNEALFRTNIAFGLNLIGNSY